MDFEEVMEYMARGFEVVGVTILAIGCTLALLAGLRNFSTPHQYFLDVRRRFGRPLILGLEVLVAADIIQTVTVDQTIESVGVLGILVAVRIALSFSLDIEFDGSLPWRRSEIEA